MLGIAILVGLALLALCYVVGRYELRREAAGRSKLAIAAGPSPALAGRPASPAFGSRRTSAALPDAAETVFLANAFDSYRTNAGLDGFLAKAQAREWEMDAVCRALQAVGAGQVVPILRRAEAEFDLYCRESDTAGQETGSAAHQAAVKTYLGAMHRLDAEIGALGLDVDRLVREFEFCNPPER